jgi:hypothetical protein
VLTTQALTETYTTAERALELYRGAEAFVVANTLGRTTQLARLGARQLVQSVDEFGDAAFTGLRRGLDGLSGASQYAVVQQVRDLPSRVRQRVAAAGATEQLVGYLARTGDEGAVLLADGGDDLIEATVSKGLLERATITRIRQLQRIGAFKQADIDRLGRLLNDGKMDQGDTETLLSILETREQSPLFGDDLTADELLDIGARADLSDSLSVAKNTDPDGNVRVFRLQFGDADRGFRKVLRKHVRGDLTNIEADGFNSFFPTGREVTINGKSQALPDTMTRDDVKRVLARALDEGRASSGSGNRIEFDYSLDETTANEFGIESVRVVVNDDGDVVTAFPTEGDNAYAWVGGRGNDGAWGVPDGDGGFVFSRISSGPLPDGVVPIYG